MSVPARPDRPPAAPGWRAAARRGAPLALLFLAGCASAPLTFEAHRVPLSRIDNPAPAKVPRSGINWKMEQYLRVGGQYRSPPDFADRFTLFLIGCGSGCREYALIDRVTGKVHPGQSVNNGRFDYRRDSRLLVITHTDGYRQPDIVDYYVWNGARMRHVGNEVRAAPED